MALEIELAGRTFYIKAQAQGYKAEYLRRIGNSSVGLIERG